MIISDANLQELIDSKATGSIKKDYYDEEMINLPISKIVEKNLQNYMNSITLPDLEEPVFIPTDRDSLDRIAAEIKQDYENKYGKTLHDADVDSILINIFAYREALTRIAMQEALKQNFVQYAQGIMLDHLGRLVGVERKSASKHQINLRVSYPETDNNVKATGTVVFTMLNGYNKNIKIPAGTRIVSSDGERFYLTANDAYIIYNNGFTVESTDISVNSPNSNQVTVPIIAEYVGSAYNISQYSYQQFMLYDTIYGLDSAVLIDQYPNGGRYNMEYSGISASTIVEFNTNFGNDHLNTNELTFEIMNNINFDETIGYIDVKAIATTHSADYAAIKRTRYDSSKPNFKSAVYKDLIFDNTSLPYGYSSDNEDDESLRERIILAPYRYTNAGSKGAYEYHIRNAVSKDELLDLKILGHSDYNHIEAGTIEIYMLQAQTIYFILNLDNKKIENVSGIDKIPYPSGATASKEMRNIVFDKINNGNIRPLTDTVKIVDLTPHNYADFPNYDSDKIPGVGIHVDLYYHKGADVVITKTKTLKKIFEYIADARKKLGKDIVKSDILTQIRQIPEVYHAKIHFIAPNADNSRSELRDSNNEILDFIRISDFQYFNYDMSDIFIENCIPVDESLI